MNLIQTLVLNVLGVSMVLYSAYLLVVCLYYEAKGRDIHGFLFIVAALALLLTFVLPEAVKPFL